MRQGARLYIPGASGEPANVVSTLEEAWPAGRELAITTSFLPGVNSFDFSKLDPAINVTGLFSPPQYADAVREGRYRHAPLSYAMFCKWLQTDAQFDAVVVQVAPPDNDGRYSLGPLVEFTMLAIQKSQSVIAVVNPNVPRLVHSPCLTTDRITTICEADAPLTTYEPMSDALSEAVAEQVASLISDDALLQVGIGKIPTALLKKLKDRRKLLFQSGLISDGVMDLVEAGATRQLSIALTCMCVGGEAFYNWLNERDDIIMKGCDYTHNPQTLAALEGFIAVNGALEVDLLGQCNLERVAGRSVSGAGGAPDFAQAARRGAGGKSIIALPAEVRGRSRIVAALGPDAIVTLPRHDIDYVVTEYGVADLRFASVHERAEQLIEVAAPRHRSELRNAWRDIAKRL